MQTKTKIISVIAVVVAVAIVLAFAINRPMDKEIYSSSDYDVTEENMIGGRALPQSLVGVASVEKIQSFADNSGDKASSQQKLQSTERLIVRTGRLSVVSNDVRKSVGDMSSYVVGIGGFVVSSNVQGTNDNPSATLEVRVPVDKFQESVDKAKTAGLRVTSESLTGEDVTEDFVDTQARIKNLQASEMQFSEIMKKAQKISDVLEVQQQLERVRGDIDVAQGHAQYLEKSAKMSSITIYFATDEAQLPVVDPVNNWNPLTIIKNAFRSLVGLAQGLGTLVIWLVIYLPLWVLIAVVVYIIKKIVRRNQQLK
jgi:hypothetical protein